MKKLPLAVRDTNHPAERYVVDPGLDEFCRRKGESIVSGVAMVTRTRGKHAAHPPSDSFFEGPAWFHPLGFHMRVGCLNMASMSLSLINGHGGAVSIVYVGSTHHEDSHDRVWEVMYHLCDAEKTVSVDWRGFFTPTQIKAAFTSMSGWNTTPYLFAREGRFLSLPTRGSRAPGNPTISVYLSDEVVCAASCLLRG